MPCGIRGKSPALRSYVRLCVRAHVHTYAHTDCVWSYILCCRKQEGTCCTCLANENPGPEEEAPKRKWLAECGFQTLTDFLLSTIYSSLRVDLFSSFFDHFTPYTVVHILQATLHSANLVARLSPVRTTRLKSMVVFGSVVPQSCPLTCLLHRWGRSPLHETPRCVFGNRGMTCKWIGRSGTHGVDGLLLIILFLTLFFCSYW